MAIHALMEKQGEGRMFVPPAKVQAYIAAGWEVIEPADPLPAVKPATLPTELQPVESEAEEKPITIPEAVERSKVRGKSRKA